MAWPHVSDSLVGARKVSVAWLGWLGHMSLMDRPHREALPRHAVLNVPVHVGWLGHMSRMVFRDPDFAAPGCSAEARGSERAGVA